MQQSRRNCTRVSIQTRAIESLPPIDIFCVCPRFNLGWLLSYLRLARQVPFYWNISVVFRSSFGPTDCSVFVNKLCQGEIQRPRIELLKLISFFPFNKISFPLAQAPDKFSFSGCKFRVRKCKESTARVVMWRQMGITNSFTMEATFCGANFGDM